jgi:Asp/Glu/hydantoin racemase
MTIYKIRQGAEYYGIPIGILLLDCTAPFIPGDVGNASTYQYPVTYRVIPGLTVQKILFEGASHLESEVVMAARDLERQGVRGITSNCGFMIQFQETVAAAVRIPVFLSSLLQIPMMAATLSPSRSIGIITASAASLTTEILSKAGVQPHHRINICGMENAPEFYAAMIELVGTLDKERLEQETVETACDLVARHPEIGAILLECADMPPYASAVQHALGLPVFDFVTMINYFHNAINQSAFRGYY